MAIGIGSYFHKGDFHLEKALGKWRLSHGEPALVTRGVSIGQFLVGNGSWKSALFPSGFPVGILHWVPRKILMRAAYASGTAHRRLGKPKTSTLYHIRAVLPRTGRLLAQETDIGCWNSGKLPELYDAPLELALLSEDFVQCYVVSVIFQSRIISTVVGFVVSTRILSTYWLTAEKYSPENPPLPWYMFHKDSVRLCVNAYSLTAFIPRSPTFFVSVWGFWNCQWSGPQYWRLFSYWFPRKVHTGPKKRSCPFRFFVN